MNDPRSRAQRGKIVPSDASVAHEPSAGRGISARGAVRALTDGLLRTAVADELVEGFRTSLARDGHAQRLGAVTAHLAADRDDAEVGALLAAAVAMADGEVDAKEHQLFEQVTQELGISRRRVEELLGR